VALEPAALPSVSIGTSKPLEWEGDLLVLAVTEEDLKVEGGKWSATTAPVQQQLLVPGQAWYVSSRDTLLTMQQHLCQWWSWCCDAAHTCGVPRAASGATAWCCLVSPHVFTCCLVL
jgi:hypothetical protein